MNNPTTRDLRPETNRRNLPEEGFVYFVFAVRALLRSTVKKKKCNAAAWQVQRRLSSVRGDVWVGRDKAKALNKNHPFWSELARGNSAAASIHTFLFSFFFFFNRSTLFHLSSILSFFSSRLCLAAAPPRLSLISPEPFGLSVTIKQDGKLWNYHWVRDAYQAAIYFLIWP